eukprot:15787524-Heterocapsa_arctica.AAC.1
MDLGSLMKVSLVLIAVFQALPGILLLACRQWMPLALKLNEFTIVLTGLEEELQDDVARSTAFVEAPGETIHNNTTSSSRRHHQLVIRINTIIIQPVLVLVLVLVLELL